MTGFPKWLYHAAQENPLMVQSAEEERMLPPGWADSPAVALELAQSAVNAKPKKGKASKPTVEGSQA